jgi:DNA-directed RNA polymerase specialized sigma24 family protein
VLLHFYLDLPLDEVAISLGISVAGAKSRINRAFKRLRPALTSAEVLT